MNLEPNGTMWARNKERCRVQSKNIFCRQKKFKEHFFAATICIIIQVAPKKKNFTYPKPKQGQLKL